MAPVARDHRSWLGTAQVHSLHSSCGEPCTPASLGKTQVWAGASSSRLWAVSLFTLGHLGSMTLVLPHSKTGVHGHLPIFSDPCPLLPS